MPLREPAPWHLWPIGILALLWHGAAALDYLAVQFHVSSYTSRLPGDWNAWVRELPFWLVGLWAVAVWGGFVGAVLILLRERQAVLALAFAFLAGAGATAGLTLAVAPPVQAVAGQAAVVLLGAGVVVLLLLWLYARAQKIRGVLD